MKKFINKIKSNKTLSILSILIIGIFFLLITRVTFAFLAPIFNSAQTDVMGASDTVDDFKFELGNPLKIDATPTKLKENGTNYVSSTTAKALLKANSTQNTATYNYYVYFLIKSNTFTYSDGSTPEIILTVTDPNGDEITSIDGLTYGTFNGVSGFDVTTKSGLFNIADNYEITSNSSTAYTTQEWNITLTYLNLSIDQSSNFGNSMEVSVYIRKEEKIITVADYCSDGENLKDCIIKYGNLGYDTSKITIHNASLLNGARDNSYRYSGGGAYSDLYSCKYDGNDVININEAINNSKKGDCSNVYKVTIGSDVIYGDNSLSTLFTNKKTVSWDSTNSKCVTSSGDDVSTFNDGTVTQDACTGFAYLRTSDNKYLLGIEEVGAGEETLVSLAQEDVSNFVCFGSTARPCPTDNLYRIIGVIDDKVKLIKYDYASSTLLGTDGDYSQNTEEAGMPTNYYKGTKEMSDIGVYYWNYKATNQATNTWSTSLLNKTNLNTNFINNIGTEWSNKIATTIWKVGGNTYAKIRNVVPSVAYQNEIVNPVPGQYSTTGETEYEAKIGLMYVSDYGFAASPESWTTIMNNYSTERNNNWMYMGYNEWTISRNAAYSNFAFLVFGDGGVNNYDVYSNHAVRPSFNLESSVTYVSGSGTQSDPIIIN